MKKIFAGILIGFVLATATAAFAYHTRSFRLEPGDQAWVEAIGIQEDDICIRYEKLQDPFGTIFGSHSVSFNHCDSYQELYEDGSGRTIWGEPFCIRWGNCQRGPGYVKPPRSAKRAFWRTHIKPYTNLTRSEYVTEVLAEKFG